MSFSTMTVIMATLLVLLLVVATGNTNDYSQTWNRLLLAWEPLEHTLLGDLARLVSSHAFRLLQCYVILFIGAVTHDYWVFSQKQRRAEAVQAELARLRARDNHNARLQDEYARLQDEYARLQGDNARLQGDNARLEGENARLLSQVTRLQNGNAGLQDYSRTQSQENARLQGDKARLLARVMASFAIRVSLRAEVRRLFSALERVFHIRTSQSEEIAFLESANLALEGDNRGLHNEVRRLRAIEGEQLPTTERALLRLRAQHNQLEQDHRDAYRQYAARLASLRTQRSWLWAAVLMLVGMLVFIGYQLLRCTHSHRYWVDAYYSKCPGY